MVTNKEIKLSIHSQMVNKRPGLVFEFTKGSRTIPLFVDQWSDVEGATVEQWEGWLGFGKTVFDNYEK